MVFQGAMNSLDPVYTIRQQFVEVLKQHHYEGDIEHPSSRLHYVSNIGKESYRNPESRRILIAFCIIENCTVTFDRIAILTPLLTDTREGRKNTSDKAFTAGEYMKKHHIFPDLR